jgi:hypothetical protein
MTRNEHVDRGAKAPPNSDKPNDKRTRAAGAKALLARRRQCKVRQRNPRVGRGFSGHARPCKRPKAPTISADRTPIKWAATKSTDKHRSAAPPPPRGSAYGERARRPAHADAGTARIPSHCVLLNPFEDACAIDHGIVRAGYPQDLVTIAVKVAGMKKRGFPPP